MASLHVLTCSNGNWGQPSVLIQWLYFTRLPWLMLNSANMSLHWKPVKAAQLHRVPVSRSNSFCNRLRLATKTVGVCLTLMSSKEMKDGCVELMSIYDFFPFSKSQASLWTAIWKTKTLIWHRPHLSVRENAHRMPWVLWFPIPCVSNWTAEHWEVNSAQMFHSNWCIRLRVNELTYRLENTKC